MVECGGLENRLACIRSRGFESLLLRQHRRSRASIRLSEWGSFLFCPEPPPRCASPPPPFIVPLQFSLIFGVRFGTILAKIYGACTHVDVKEPVVSLATYAIAAAPAALAIPVTSGAVDTPVAVPVWLELIAIVVASISGALTAREKKLDLVGAVCLAVLCSLGGGLLRDVTLQVGNVYILNQPIAMPAAILTAAVVFVAPSVIAKQDRLIAVLDIFAVGLYAATGADKALVYGFDPIICITMGFFTGVGGGMLRDVFLGQVPYIFQRSNLYAVAAIAGAGVYVLFAAAGISHVVGVVACVGVTMGASAFVENNYFRSEADQKPMMSSMQGTDIAGGHDHTGISTYFRLGTAVCTAHWKPILHGFHDLESEAFI